jgi:hypothetical protein
MKRRIAVRAASDTKPRSITAVLQFDRTQDLLASGKRLSGGMSAVAAIGDTLWLTHDETVDVERLRADARGAKRLRYADHRRFELRQFVALPAKADAADAPPPEADIEGVAYGDGYLWLAGSHSALREGADGRTPAAAIAALARVRRAGNRFLLARIPVAQSAQGPWLVSRATAASGEVRTAARLPGGRKHDALTRALRDDPHLGPFLAIPSKDNGFDVEGLAAAPGGRLFLGLRGPVIDGWACVLELRVRAHRLRDRELTLQKIARDPTADRRSTLFRKHFLDLGGAGIRDLCLAGRDLLLLTGPPMRGKGTAKVRRWRHALSSRGERLLKGADLPTLLEIPYRARKNHAEGIAVLGRAGDRVRLIVIYDSAEGGRTLPPAAMPATVHDLVLA